MGYSFKEKTYVARINLVMTPFDQEQEEEGGRYENHV